jgi:hypothetical protein
VSEETDMGADYCQHPTLRCFVESGEDDAGYWENHFCVACQTYLTRPEIEEIQARPDWVEWQAAE